MQDAASNDAGRGAENLRHSQRSAPSQFDVAFEHENRCIGEMLVRRLELQNVRSFKERVIVEFDRAISIIIGPNGGGKTNLLDALITMLRKHLANSMWPVLSPTAEEPDRHVWQSHAGLDHLVLEKHSGAPQSLEQLVSVELEVTATDVVNIATMKSEAPMLLARANKKYQNLPIERFSRWVTDGLTEGRRLQYQLRANSFASPAGNTGEATFLDYLQTFEAFARLQTEYGRGGSVSTPVLYFPTNRAAGGFASSIQLSGFNEVDSRRGVEGTSSRSNGSIVHLAIGSIAQQFRLLLEEDRGEARQVFRSAPKLQELSSILEWLGYTWELISINPLTNQYDIRLSKQGSSFLVHTASSGERELLTYLFGIYALNVSDAVVLVDEPELHLHPKWQKALLEVFERLARSTGNQFILATHSPTFISPKSIEYVSRVYSRSQSSAVVRLNAQALPTLRQLLSIVTTHNNEKIFFADRVVLVEGIHDRAFFERVLQVRGPVDHLILNIEVVSVGGKHCFEQYRRVLDAARVDYVVVADFDYIDQIGSEAVKKLFSVDGPKIKKDVIDNVGSFDGQALVDAIDGAMTTGNWDHARASWEYIKSRHKRSRPVLHAEEQSVLDAFLCEKRSEGIFVLTQGALEAYLPVGLRAKNLDKLLEFLAVDTFWETLDVSVHEELDRIVAAAFAPLKGLTPFVVSSS